MTERPINLAVLARQKRDHDIFAPSASNMWGLCAGSLIANIINPRPSGRDAASGTVSHNIAREWLITGKCPVKSGDTRRVDGHEIEIDDERLERIESYIDFCEAEAEFGDVVVEERVDISRVTPIPNQRGSVDFAVMSPGVLTVADFKDGRIRIRADIPQLKLYALGLFDRFDATYAFQRIKLYIHQPRVGHYDAVVLERQDLLEFVGYIRERARLAWSKSAVRTPGSVQCQYCSESGQCMAQYEWFERLTHDEDYALDLQVTHEQMRETHSWLGSFGIADMELPYYTRLQLDDMAALLPYSGLADSFFNNMKAKAEEIERDNPGSIPGFKLVNKRKHRAWITDPERVVSAFVKWIPREKVMKEKLVSPAQVEKLIKAANMPEDTREIAMKTVLGMQTKPTGEPELVPESDTRPAIQREIDINDVYRQIDDL
jgi:hypothetical protein